MDVGLNLSNPGPTINVGLYIWIDLPDGGRYWYLQMPSLDLPSALEYSNPSFESFTLPSITPGTYRWVAVLYDHSASEVIDYSLAPWTFTNTTSSPASEEDLKKAIRKNYPKSKLEI
jgi:hypothetical protein